MQIVKYRIYPKSKAEKVEKYRLKMQKHYNRSHDNDPTSPLVICCPVVTWDNKYAVPLVGEGYPENDGDDEILNSIERPVVEE